MNLNYLKDKHKNFLFKLLQKREDMTFGTLGKYSGSNYTIDWKEDAKPFSIPTIHKPTLEKQQVNRST